MQFDVEFYHAQNISSHELQNGYNKKYTFFHWQWAKTLLVNNISTRAAQWVYLDICWNRIQETYRKFKEKQLAEKDQNIDASAKLQVGMLGKTMENIRIYNLFSGWSYSSILFRKQLIQPTIIKTSFLILGFFGSLNWPFRYE